MQDPAQSVLISSGLSDKESAVYLALLSLGSGNVTQIAEHAHLKRSVVYLVIDRLMKRGFVIEFPGHKIRRFSPVDPQRIYQAILSNTENLKHMVPFLRAMHNQGAKVPKVEFYEDVTAITNFYRTLEVGKISRYVSSYELLKTHFPEEVKRWLRRGLGAHDTNQGRHLVHHDRADIEFAKHFRGSTKQEFRFLPNKIQLNLDIAIVDNFVALSSFDPLFLVVIHSDTFAHGLQVIFDMAWATAKKVT